MVVWEPWYAFAIATNQFDVARHVFRLTQVLPVQVRAAVLRRMPLSPSPVTFASTSDLATLITAIEKESQRLTAVSDALQVRGTPCTTLSQKI